MVNLVQNTTEVESEACNGEQPTFCLSMLPHVQQTSTHTNKSVRHKARLGK
ncbi:unnamed protein product [Acanthoscelides obtectus]|uniref:Uncharacterized protein n=1 Tax=Acanthoscelides obtectus TaxID=200917 RepID=A0A9P0L7R9_ACAOB|nr:unnamed protein product [Acanthoscelides obtectus]CAK1653094.1 hypothetical protein AOBTE_LOCUS18057 [Acanthoscelides obtectus]